ncbi:MAG TPA: PqqD family peptide modification chaperone [Jiangellaceae bacterium]
MTDAPTRTAWLDARPAPKAGLVLQPVDGEIVIYDPEADALHHLEPTAAAVWTLLDGHKPVHAIAADLAAKYGAAEASVRRDVLDLAELMHDRGLLVGSAGVPASTGRRTSSGPTGEFDLGDRPPPPVPHVTRALRGLEHTFEVATNDIAVRDFLDQILVDLGDDGRDDGGRGDRARHELAVLSESRYLVRYQDRVVVVTGRLDRALSVLLWHVNAEVVRRSAPRFPLVHAAAAARDGATVLLPAAPGSGKTTTVAGLVAGAGFGYLTDEAVMIDAATLTPHSYPKPLSIDRGSWEVLAGLRPSHHDVVTGQWQVPASAIRRDAVASAAPVRFVVEPAYDRAADTRLEHVSRAAMLLRLADSTFNFQEAPQRNLAVLARVLERADCYRLPISDLGDGVRLIRRLFGDA